MSIIWDRCDRSVALRFRIGEWTYQIHDSYVLVLSRRTWIIYVGYVTAC